MVTKAVSMDMKVGPSNRTRPQDGEASGGFSDILGSVSSENRRQQGTSGSSKRESTEEKNFRGEFRFTEKADGKAPGSAVQTPDGRQPFTPKFSESGKAPDEEAVDKLMSEAMELVIKAVTETGEKPTREEAAEMLLDALKTLVPEKDRTLPENEDTEDIVDSLMDILTAMAENGGVVPTAAVETVIPEDTIPDETEPGSDTVNADRLTISDKPEQTAQQPVHTKTVRETDSDTAAAEPTVQQDTKLISAETEESAAPEKEMTFAEHVRSVIPEESRETDDIIPEHIVPEIPTGTPMRDIQAAARPIQPELMMPAEEIPEEPETPELTIIVSDTVKMLSELIDDAKKELGLTEFRIEQFTGEEAPEMPETAGTQAAIAFRMGQNDRSGELDHILTGETRFDIADEKEQAPKTETYDAVHMAAELMSDRMHTEMPDNEPMFPEAMKISPPEVQTAEQILDRIQNMQGDHTEFTMVLNPEALGRITVKLIAAGEKISVEISAENPDTRAILAARTESLQGMLRDNGVQLDRCQIVSEQEDTRFDQQSYEGSSKNPYGRNDEDSQQDDGDDDSGSFYDLLQTL